MQTTLDEYQAFIAVVDAGSITGAANQLGLTVSAISRSLARLEEKLGTTLLRRTTRRLLLTDEGRVLLDRARGIVDAVDAAEQQMAISREQPTGRLRVDAATPFMLHVVVPRIGGFLARYPRIELELDSNEGIVDLIEHRTDVAIRIGPLRDSTLHARPLGSSRRQLVASPAYLQARGKPRKPADLAGHVLIGFNRPDTLNEWPLHTQDGSLLHIAPTVASSSGETQRQLALAGQGIACLSDFMTAADIAAGTLVPVLPRDTVPVPQPLNAVYYRNTALAVRITCFLDYLSECLEDMRKPAP